MTTNPTISNRRAKIKAHVRGLEEKFPHAFRGLNVLKVGIDADIAVALGNPDNFQIIKAAIGFHVNRRSYLAATVAGAQRVDLNGEPCGTVTDADASNAAIKLARIREIAKNPTTNKIIPASKAPSPAPSPAHRATEDNHVPQEKVSQSKQCETIASSLGIRASAPRKAGPVVVVVKRRRVVAQ